MFLANTANSLGSLTEVVIALHLRVVLARIFIKQRTHADRQISRIQPIPLMKIMT